MLRVGTFLTVPEGYTYIGPVLSSSKALWLIARSLHQCCRVQFNRMMTHASRGNNMKLCLRSPDFQSPAESQVGSTALSGGGGGHESGSTATRNECLVAGAGRSHQEHSDAGHTFPALVTPLPPMACPVEPPKVTYSKKTNTEGNGLRVCGPNTQTTAAMPRRSQEDWVLLVIHPPSL